MGPGLGSASAANNGRRWLRSGRSPSKTLKMPEDEDVKIID
jgi:hypothetical protein